MSYIAHSMQLVFTIGTPTQIRGSLSGFASGNSLELYNRKYNIIGLNEPILVKGAGLHAGSRRTKPGETG